MIEINKDPSPRDLFWFGRLLPVFGAAFGLVVGRTSGSMTAAVVIWLLLAAAALAYAALPALRRPFYVGWLRLTYPIGWVIGHLLLAAVFFGVLTPMGLVMRALGRDPLRRRFDRQAASYWVPRAAEPEPERYFRQF